MEWIRKYRNILLLVLLLATLVVTWFFARAQEGAQGGAVTLPLQSTASTAPESELTRYLRRRDEEQAADRAALQALCDNAALDERTREDAAEQLKRLIDRCEKQTAVEGALSQSGFAPCGAVLTEGALTIVTEKTGLSGGESALLLEIAEVHAGVEPSGVRVVTAEEP